MKTEISFETALLFIERLNRLDDSLLNRRIDCGRRLVALFGIIYTALGTIPLQEDSLNILNQLLVFYCICVTTVWSGSSSRRRRPPFASRPNNLVGCAEWQAVLLMPSSVASGDDMMLIASP